jgi:hypothetical protein
MQLSCFNKYRESAYIELGKISTVLYFLACALLYINSTLILNILENTLLDLNKKKDSQNN